MIASHVTLGVEYNYTDLGSRTHSGNATVTGFGPAFPTPYSISVDPDKIQDVTARLTLLLNCTASA